MKTPSPSSAHDSEREEQRQYTISISEADRQKSFQIEDERWSRSNQLRDWLILGVMVFVTLFWMILVYLLEPGLR